MMDSLVSSIRVLVLKGIFKAIQHRRTHLLRPPKHVVMRSAMPQDSKKVAVWTPA